MEKQTNNDQMIRVKQELAREPQTTMMVSERTGILRANITRYVAHLRKRGQLHELRKGECPITKHRATFYTCDPHLIPKPGQAELFSAERGLPGQAEKRQDSDLGWPLHPQRGTGGDR